MGKKKGGGGGGKKKAGVVQSGGKVKGVSGGRQGSKGKGKGSSSGGSEGGSRKQNRQEAREAARIAAGRRQKRAHGKEGAIEETRQRLRLKVLQRQLTRGPTAKPCEERRAVLRELATLHAEAGRQKPAIESLQEALDFSPNDPDFGVRAPLLCLYMDRAKTEEAASMLKGPLFEKILAEAASNPAERSADAAARQETITVGCYSIALLSYISVCVLQEYRKKPKEGKAAEERLLQRTRAARVQNPFVAEFLAFAPAFEPVFPYGCDIPPAVGATPEELAMLEALRYCCRLGGRGQAAVWLDTDEQVRRFLRETLFEEDEQPPEQPGGDQAGEAADEPPPMAVLPAPAAGEPEVLSRWRRAREEAMDLWATEMAADADIGSGSGQEGGEEGGEEERDFSDDEEMDDFEGAEERRFG